ncbi:MAG: N-formylglutamate amidohydrolase [Woeseiaceae bacterium]
MSESLLKSDELAPAMILNPDASSPIVLVCEHASDRLPSGLDGQYPAALMATHFACDWGTRELVTELAALLDATAVVANYSRIVIDCNRRLADPTLVLSHADGVPVQPNTGLNRVDLQQRIDQLYVPFHATVSQTLMAKERQGRLPVYVAIHSFTPRFDGEKRPWDIGIMSDHDRRFADPVIAALSNESGIVVGDNKPYSGREVQDFSVDYHAERAGLANVAIEVRQDHLTDSKGVGDWSARLSRVLSSSMMDNLTQARLPVSGLVADFSEEQRLVSASERSAE